MTTTADLRTHRISGLGEKYRDELRAAPDLDRIGDVWRLTLEARRNGQIEGLCVAALQIERDDAIERLSPKGAA
ncbi:MAG TPA: hypothetical protein VK841_01105 [Polyangiaceae bacterium]|nr:hypothetical protein [Polyangiaceae bacterium]